VPVSDMIAIMTDTHDRAGAALPGQFPNLVTRYDIGTVRGK
jgi:hypothetical protein